MDALREGRTVEDRFEQHLAPVALHLRIAFQGVGQVPGRGGDRLVEFHQAFEFRFQLAPLGGLRGVDPVSYTHLDVYKRQAGGPAGSL